MRTTNDIRKHRKAAPPGRHDGLAAVVPREPQPIGDLVPGVIADLDAGQRADHDQMPDELRRYYQAAGVLPDTEGPK